MATKLWGTWPIEVRCQILGNLSYKQLKELDLDNKQYWEIFRVKYGQTKWQKDRIWLRKFYDDQLRSTRKYDIFNYTDPELVYIDYRDVIVSEIRQECHDIGNLDVYVRLEGLFKWDTFYECEQVFIYCTRLMHITSDHDIEDALDKQLQYVLGQIQDESHIFQLTVKKWYTLSIKFSPEMRSSVKTLGSWYEKNLKMGTSVNYLVAGMKKKWKWLKEIYISFKKQWLPV